MQIPDSKTYTMIEVEESGGVPMYAIVDDSTKEIVRAGHNPTKLSNWAFNNGYMPLRHAYDLRKAENAPW